MTSFRHHPDGWIYIGQDCYPLSWFKQQEPGYSLPEGATSREYLPSERHSLYSKDSQWGGTAPWTEGDRYLSKASTYKAAWQAANQPEPTPEPETQPNWVGFRVQMTTQSAYFRVVASHPKNGVLNTLLVQLLFNVGQDPGLLPEVAQIWNAMEANVPLTEVEILQLNTIATACKIPLRLNVQGQMEV